MHTILISEQGQIISQSGNLFPLDMIMEFSPRLLCPILNSIFDELVKLKPSSPAIFIPAVNLTVKSINGYFDYLLSKKENGNILWIIEDTTESNNNKLVRLQPEMEQKLRNETESFLNFDKNCDIPE